MEKEIIESAEIGGKQLTLRTGKLASQANASILASYGETMVLATVVASKCQEDRGYFPLWVEYIERLYAGGRIKGSRWVKREGKPSDEAVLTARLIDRSIRPLFPKDYSKEVQVIITVLSIDTENNPDVLALVAASAALAISSVPWRGPVGAVRVGLQHGTCFANPANGEMNYSDLDLIIASTQDACVMIEAGAKEVAEEEVLKAVDFGQEEAKKIIDLINSLVKKAGKKKEVYERKKIDPLLKKEVLKQAGGRIKDLLRKLSVKESGFGEYDELKTAVSDQIAEEKKKDVGAAIEELLKEELRRTILAGERLDGRKIDEIRPIEATVSVLPRTHGSALFNRGETQVLTVTTLGSLSLEQLIESPAGEETKRFIHHYSMPPFSVGETGRVGWPSRREIGHGALAERALEAVIPSEEQFPYTISLVSEVLTSNGSTSMASTCGATLSLMDAGVPLSAPVAGLALGLVEEAEKTVVLSDIVGLEDAYGDMDFKIAGTQNGITALQLDVKNLGLKKKMIEEALRRGQEGRKFILGKMGETLTGSRKTVSRYAPKVVVLHLPVDKIGEVIGPGGRTIRRMIEETQTEIDVSDDGAVNISGLEQSGLDKAVAMIKGLTAEVNPGEIYEGEVKRIQPFGAFVEVLPGKEGLVHVSQMSDSFVDDPSKIVSLGQKVKVKVIEIDDRKRINLTMLLDGKRESKRSFSKTPFKKPRF